MSLATTSPTKPARSSSREALLDAAEALFAEHGYDAVSIRDITGRANVRLAMASYHFGTKDKLFDAVIARRAEALNRDRRASLDELQRAGTPDVEAVLRAFIWPYMELATTGGPGWASYCRLIAQSGPGDRWRDQLSRHFDETAQRFIDAIHAKLPHVRRSVAVRGFVFAVGTMVSAFSGNRRATRLSGGELDADDLTATCKAMVPFLAAGIEALAKGNHAHEFGGEGGGCRVDVGAGIRRARRGS
jgi:AcrR family transcriptional regulator